MVKRDPIQVDPEFRERLNSLKRKIEEVEKKEISLRELTKRIVKTGGIEDFEKKLLNGNTGQINFQIKLDRRLLK
jgi:hypothetical protein